MTNERITGWQRQLENGRVEIFVRTAETKVRAHGSTADMNDLLDWVESKVGCAVEAPWRQRKGPAPMRGQLDLLNDQYAELDMEAA